MKENKSIYLDFKGYEVIKLNMNKISKPEKEHDNNIGFTFRIIPNNKKDFTKTNIIQGVKINATEEFPYEIEVVLKGNFELGNCETDEEKMKFIITNASAILFPYIRASVSLISSQLEYEKILLPVINFSKIFEKTDLESLLMEHTQFEDF
ncbi:preprotein translocase subunit SecB [Acetoanaerobium pronyense]|uniref:Preprotein translocase subunit SecB n=1 Tax=Acetoanaerobium pronyense TaxID=1482736 RepID=A0ABS4KMI0_9FIRM|nr:protein-export chaperone SecB [Acetoanaerobium pronyense]MBP2028987.1 preprotein translocase subunit SecB [Acetoanaerobium pronyense]